MAGNWTPPWPSWRDGWPVKVGETAMSLIGPLRIDGIEIMDGGWRLWSNQSMYPGADRWLYIIDEGDWEDSPTRSDEYCDFWAPEDGTMPDFVYAPVALEGGGA